MNSIICSDSIRNMVLFDDASSKPFPTAADEIMSLKVNWQNGRHWLKVSNGF
ncbi:hypothetical protein SGGMMB4_02330 [Sodalis glossinidius str. 'morsitans']|uniref:Uncharacterized protein n=1 Tax=Sodalis glossinidius (strain morsitans) TaxID=343509 RepID=A0A193QJ19_SODGM|nr:hypothetical protein [Sodalis glossinidius]CRL44920.1 hypothetical protein SGGMMB4_02330 [Sodalis glossinidius str. 'morsitans']